MAGKYTGLQKTYTVGVEAGIPKYSGVTYGAVDGEVVIPLQDNEVFVGIVDNDERIAGGWSATGDQRGKNIAVQITGYGAIKLGEDVIYGDELILGTGGVAIKIPTAGAAEKTILKVTAAATGSGNLNVVLNGEDNAVAVLEEDTAAEVATKIATVLNALEGYSATAVTDTVTITAASKGDQVDTTFDGGDTGVTATVTVDTQGVADGSGTYNVIGYAEESGSKGGIIPVRINPFVKTVGA